MNSDIVDYYDFEDDDVVLQIGDIIPPLEIKCFHEGVEKTIKFEDLFGQDKWVVLFFYPADFTFVCPTELRELADNYDKFKELGVEVISVSGDTVFVHKAWHDNSEAIKGVRFPMGSDTTGEISKMFGVYNYETGLSERGTFVISPDAKLRAIEIVDSNIGRSSKELLRKIRALKFVDSNDGKVCPASWDDGDDVLEPGMDLVGKI